MILNIHGLDGKSKNTNYRELLKRFGEEELASPQLDYRANSAADIAALLKKEAAGKELIVAKSLGGFFAAYLSADFQIPCILVNPCLRPDLYLDRLMDGYLAANADTIGEMMDTISRSPYLTEHAHMILGKDDDLLDPNDAAGVLPAQDTVFLPGGHDISGEEFARVFAGMVDKILK